MIKIARDKWKHFFIGIPLGIMLQLAGIYILSLTGKTAAVLAVIALTLGCYGFELFSKITGKGHYEIMDVVAGVIGGLLGIVAVLVFL